MRRNIAKAIAYIILLAIILPLVTLIIQKNPTFKEYESYLPYIQAALIFGIGYKALSSISNIAYDAMRRATDHSTASVIKTVIKIAGIALLISTLATIFNVSASSALTVGSFSGLVIGFATQSVLTHAVAGIFIAISRPFKYGDLVTIAGQTGEVKEITIMHTKLESSEGNKDILIPSGKIIGEIIIRTREGKKV